MSRSSLTKSISLINLSLLNLKSIASKMCGKHAILPLCYVSALAQLARFATEAFEQKSDVIMSFLVKRILMLPSPVDAVGAFFCIHFPRFIDDTRTRSIRTKTWNGWMMMMSRMTCVRSCFR